MTSRDIPPWTVAAVDAQRMKTMAALLRDPYPVHWDRAGNERLGYGARVVNQGPLNVGYIVNMLEGRVNVRQISIHNLLVFVGFGCCHIVQIKGGFDRFDGKTMTPQSFPHTSSGLFLQLDLKRAKR